MVSRFGVKLAYGGSDKSLKPLPHGLQPVGNGHIAIKGGNRRAKKPWRYAHFPLLSSRHAA
jgi:hypothetical protein